MNQHRNVAGNTVHTAKVMMGSFVMFEAMDGSRDGSAKREDK